MVWYEEVMTITLGIFVSFALGLGIGIFLTWMIQKAKIKTSQDQSILFESLSAKALRDNNQTFALLVDPVKTTLDKFEKQIQELERKREGAYSGLHQQVEFLHKTNQQLKTETTTLTQALRSSSQIRGHWGEYQLRNIIEMAGMLKYCDFVEQSASEDRSRPDVVVRLPGKGNIVIDAKTPSVMELHDAIHTEDATAKKQKLQILTQKVRDEANKLAKKNYWENFQPSPDFVLLFLPTDAMYIAALEQDPRLLEIGAQQKVFITTPTSLISLLRCVAVGWQQVQITKEAGEIAKLGKELHERVSSMAAHFSDLGKKLGGAVDAYNKTVSSLETRMLPTARKFQSLQQTGVPEISQMQALESMPREPQADELRTAGATVNLIKPKT